MVVIRKQECERALRRGIDFLRSSQKPNGEFTTLAGRDPDFLSSCYADPCNFTTMHVAHSLLASGASEALALVRPAADFLLSQMLPGGLWRFWTSDHPGALGMPPDVDDTACVTHLLTCLGYPVPDNRSILMANRDAGGLFYTWIRPRARLASVCALWPTLSQLVSSRRAVSAFFRSGVEPPTWDAVDAVVNANALLVCGDDPRTASVVSWFCDLARREHIARADRFYQSELAFAYAVTRALASGITALKVLLPPLSGIVRGLYPARLSPLESAQLICAAGILGEQMHVVDSQVRSLLEEQRSNGSWSARAQYYGGYARARAWGSAELTTGFCVEALGCYLKATD